jgi:hypothetical protein
MIGHFNIRLRIPAGPVLAEEKKTPMPTKKGLYAFSRDPPLF